MYNQLKKMLFQIYYLSAFFYICMNEENFFDINETGSLIRQELNRHERTVDSGR